ncbi:unnamed protein product [Meganyctiphanes norvegica]|uniref:Uncharacterized protein n=1 Tax=Meganyctiphanes norvegica TaxID=48144 RepID=A0AAV2QKP2_MEGNR
MDQPMDQDGSECTQELSEKKDYGLSLLVPLYKLMRNNCAQAMFKIVLTMFSACKFFSDNEDAPNQLNKDMFEFLKAINNKGTNKQKKKKGKPNEDKELENRSWQIFNYQDNEEILNKISVHSMLAADEEKCKLLKNLDLNFLLNIVTNAILLYPLSENALKSVIQVKDIRNELYHARYNFSRNDFDLNLKRLQNALQEIYSALGIPEDELIKQIEECKEECKKESEEPDLIFKELQKEIHEKYKPPKHYFWPTIKEASDGEDICVESLENYLRDHNSQPTLLCGRRGSGKTSTLQNEAYHLVKKINDQGDKPQFPLVILFEENPQLPLKKENFWENVINSIKNLAPKTNARYGIETLMVVLKMHIKETIFFVNWNLHDIKTQYKETSNGTWLFTYHGYPLKSADWNILIMEPLTEHQAKQLLQSLNPNPRDWEIVNRRFCACTYKNILTTPDMVKIFSEFNNDSLTGTEYELMIKYVEKKMNEGNLSNKTIETVGRLSFYGIKK